MEPPAIIGVGVTKFGELWEKSFLDLFLEAGLEAIQDAGISGEDIQAIYGGCMSAGRLLGQEHIAALIADQAGLAELNIPALRIELADASGAAAMAEAVLAVSSGRYQLVIVGGVEKMTDVPRELAEEVLSSGMDLEWEGFPIANLFGAFALMARAHMQLYGTTREQLAMVAVKNHANGALNPIAQYRRQITLQDVLESPLVADPLRMLDCCSICDGAAALVVASHELAKKLCPDPIYILASVQRSGPVALHSRRDITIIPSVVAAAKEAYAMAKISDPIHQIQLAEVHDLTTISEIICIEDLGFFPKGQGGIATQQGLTQLNSKISINPSGGLKSCGHAPGATGVRQLAELVIQLRGEAGKRQVEDAQIGLAQNLGGTGGSCVIHILGCKT